MCPELIRYNTASTTDSGGMTERGLVSIHNTHRPVIPDVTMNKNLWIGTKYYKDQLVGTYLPETYRNSLGVTNGNRLREQCRQRTERDRDLGEV